MSATLIPDPPVRADDADTLRLTSLDVAGALAGGVYGVCSMCRGASYSWLDLSALALEPVVGPDGTLTDQVCLHVDCVGSLIGYWVSLVTGEPVADESVGGQLIEHGASGDRFAGESERDALMGGMYG